MCKKEYDNLRDELHNLKKCQVTFFTASITATGVILTVAAKINSDLAGIVYLFPLSVLIPSWVVFLDKATTITRIVGYYRVLENFFLDKNLQKYYIGWENSLKMFREKESIVSVDEEEVKGSYFNYWNIVNNAYLILSVICVILTIITIKIDLNIEYLMVTLSLGIVTFISYRNWKIKDSLIKGRHSYNTNEKIWREILLR